MRTQPPRLTTAPFLGADAAVADLHDAVGDGGRAGSWLTSTVVAPSSARGRR